MTWRSVGLLAVLMFGAADARAYRVEFIATVSGERLRGSEVCLYEAGSGQGPAATYLASNEVRCLPADQIIDMPSGVWSFYGRHADGWVSAHGSALIHRGPANPEQGYRVITVDLQRAAYISFERVPKTSDRFAAYVPMTESATYAPATFPLASGEQRIAVPAGHALTLLRVRDGKPVGAGPLSKLGADETVDALELLPAEGERDLIGWTQIDAASLEEMANVEAPLVRLVDAQDDEHVPLFDMDSAGAAHEGLVIFRNVPAGTSRLRLDGRSWRTTDVAVNMPANGGGRFIEAPLVARLPQRLSVRWLVPAAFTVGPATCHADGKDVAPKEWSVQLLVCAEAERSGPPGNLSGCRVERQTSIEAQARGVAIFDMRKPGRYVAVLNQGTARLGMAPVVVTAGKDAAVDLEVTLPAVFGRVTEGDRPVEALVRFETGSALADTTGAYSAVLEADPRDNVIEIIPCDGSDPFQHIPAEEIVGSRQYDIHIPGNRVAISVVDAATGKPIPQAAVGRGLFATAGDARRAVSADDLRADDSGRAILRRLQPGYFLRVCARAEGYADGVCAEPVELAADTQAELNLQLRRGNLRRGRITSPTRIEGGIVYRVARGVVVEESRMEADGSFVYRGDTPAEFAIVTALKGPLFVVPHPVVPDDGELRIEVPPGRTRDFTVEISDAMRYRSGWFTLVVGDVVVPLNVLAAHLTRRGYSSYVEEGGPVRVVDILESAPLRILAVLGSYPQPRSAADLFVLPQYADIRELRPVPPNGKVVFDRN